MTPRVDAVEKEWYEEQLKRMGQRMGPYPRSPPARVQPSTALQWADWTPAVWQFYKRWAQLRVAPGFQQPNGTILEQLNICPMCNAPRVSLVHILGECEGTVRFRGAARSENAVEYTEWALAATEDMEELRKKVCAVGLAVAEMRKAMVEKTRGS